MMDAFRMVCQFIGILSIFSMLIVLTSVAIMTMRDRDEIRRNNRNSN